MCVAVTAQWYKCLWAPAGSLHHTGTEREKKLSLQRAFLKPASLKSKQALKSHSPYSPWRIQIAAAQLLHQMICFLNSPLPPQHYPSFPPSLSFFQLMHSCFPIVLPLCHSEALLKPWVFCWDRWCGFKVLIDVQSPHDVGSCCQRSQPVGVPVWLEWRSHLDPC